MGIYIQTPGQDHYKATKLIDTLDARVIAVTPGGTPPEFNTDPDLIQIAVVVNPGFDAAMVVGDEHDHARASAEQNRPVTWLLANRERVVATMREQGVPDKQLAFYGVIPSEEVTA